MPTYVYECRVCERVFEVEQRIVEDALTDCDCGAKGGLRRVIQPVGVMFKGSGFYVNDSAGASAKPSEKAETNEPKESKAESKSESKEKKADAPKKPEKTD